MGIKEHIEVEEQTGHIFPVTLVGNTINKMIDYNNQLVSFTEDIDYFNKQMEEALKKGEGKINLSYISKIAEKFCKRINYLLALLRYYLIKALSGIFKAFQEVIQPINSLIEMVRGLLSISIDTIVTAVINFASSLLTIILKPYETFVQFGIDVTTYGPKAVNESSNLMNSVTETAEKGSAFAQEIENQIGGIDNTNFTEEIKRRLQEKYSAIDTSKISIHFEPITLNDIMNGNPVKPKWEDFK